MRIFLGKDFDGGVYPPVPEGKQAVAGTTYAGPAGFLRILETTLGLSADLPGPNSRVIALINELSKSPGFYDASFKADSYETALKLLQWRDYLCECGWQGQPVSQRLEQLAKVIKPVTKSCPGVPERLEKILERLRFLSPEISEVIFIDPAQSFSPLWQKVFATLKNMGISLVERLQAKSKIEESPNFNAGIKLLRTASATEAAASVAKWLANNPQIWAETVIIGADSVLDSALSKLGLPTLAGHSYPGRSNLLQLIPAFISLFWNSDNPEKIQEFLSLYNSPLPTGLRFSLARVLAKIPSTISQQWHSKINDYLAGLNDPDKANELRELLSELFQQNKGAQVEKEALVKRLDLVKKWVCQQFAISGKLSESTGQLYFNMFLQQEKCFRELLNNSESSHFNCEETSKLVAIATKASSSMPTYPAQAGYYRVANPGSMIADAKFSIWWNFNFGCADQPFMMPLSVDEKQKLAAAGVSLPEYSLTCQQLSQLWKRPIENATEMAVLVCPKKDITGSSQTLHPLWNEIKAQLPQNIANTICSEIPDLLPAANKIVETILPPEFREKWQHPGFILRRHNISRKGLELLVRCPFAFIMEYQARIRPGSFTTIPGKNLLAGNLFHHVIETLFNEKPFPKTLEAMKQNADSILLKLGNELAPAFFQPQGMIWKNAIENALYRSLETLFPLLDPSNKSNDFESEKKLACNYLNFSLEGRVDFIHTGNQLVLDFKWDSFNRNWNTLSNGTAIQLLVYSWLVKETENLADWPGFGYLICRSGKIIANSQISSGHTVVGPDTSLVWDSFTQLFQHACDELNSGNVVTGNSSKSDNFSDDNLTLAAPCSYCYYSTLCGKRFE